jgi:hypothetical protein
LRLVRVFGFKFGRRHKSQRWYRRHEAVAGLGGRLIGTVIAAPDVELSLGVLRVAVATRSSECKKVRGVAVDQR